MRWLNRTKDNTDSGVLSEKIRKDLVLCLSKKGMGVSRIQIEIKPDFTNIRICIATKK